MADTGIIVVGTDGKRYNLQGTLVPDPMPTPTPTPVPTPIHQNMPVGDLPGWKQVFTENFGVDCALGQFVSAYGSRWEPYPDGWQQTFGFSNPARYNTTLTCYVSGGILHEKLHQARFRDIRGIEDNYWLSPALQPKVNGRVLSQLYGKYTVCFRSDPLATYKTAWLLWPVSGAWPRDGEIDFPEGGLDGTIHAFMHRQGATSGSDQDAYSTQFTYRDWHVADIEWAPTYCQFKLDGQVIGRSTSRIPNTPMRYVLQTEGCWGGTPAPGASATLQVGWFVAYQYMPTLTGNYPDEDLEAVMDRSHNIVGAYQAST